MLHRVIEAATIILLLALGVVVVAAFAGMAVHIWMQILGYPVFELGGCK